MINIHFVTANCCEWMHFSSRAAISIRWRSKFSTVALRNPWKTVAATFKAGIWLWMPVSVCETMFINESTTHCKLPWKQFTQFLHSFSFTKYVIVNSYVWAALPNTNICLFPACLRWSYCDWNGFVVILTQSGMSAAFYLSSFFSVCSLKCHK